MTKEELLTKWGITEVFLQKFPHAKILLERGRYDAVNLAIVDSFEEIKNNFYQVFLDEDREIENIYEVDEDEEYGDELEISPYNNLLEDGYD